VATCVVEVRDGRVTNYRGDYEAYLYSVNKEIDDGEREQATRMSKPPAAVAKSNKVDRRQVDSRQARRSERDIRKEMTTLERTIARLDEQKKILNCQLMQATGPAEALRLHNEVAALTSQLAEAEGRWFHLQEDVADAE
jgi:ATP-binding cassette subfamily F protein 3